MKWVNLLILGIFKSMIFRFIYNCSKSNLLFARAGQDFSKWAFATSIGQLRVKWRNNWPNGGGVAPIEKCVFISIFIWTRTQTKSIHAWSERPTDHRPFTIYHWPPKKKGQAPLTTNTTTIDNFLQPQLDFSKIEPE